MTTNPPLPNTLGWTMKSHHRSGGMIGTWYISLNEAIERALDIEKISSNDGETTKIEFIRAKYKDRMNV
jgi:hypothetical protein